MKKQLITMAILSSLSLNAEGFYAGLDFEVGSGTHEISVDNVPRAESDSLSASSFGLHVGYQVIPNGSVELSYGALSLEDDDVTRIGADYIQSFPMGSLKPYAGIGLSTNSMSDANIKTGFGGRLRAGAYYEIMSNLDLGAEFNYNYISWESETDSLGREWELSTSYYGLGVNLNYKF
ncbi:hypothetical protein MNB_SV-13-517 [hydrothermal vent metagenome]|uniref:Outer membrane protein beta-barrel domain-containing protein n=1 Tax=hydrothermal vent metagenome TaxID=652676 RepID=A0A1W1CWF9_9ZZZZ